MSTRSTKSHARAVGALLFGGTLALANSADAGFVLNNRSSSGAYASFQGFDSWIPVNWQSSSPAVFGNAQDRLTMTWSSTTLSAVKSNGTNGRMYMSEIWIQFTVDSAAPITVNIASGINANATLRSNATYATLGTWGAGGGSGSFTLSDSTAYSFLFQCDALASSSFTSGTLFSLSFAPVPAPGAIALLGMAGLGKRRRR